MRYAAICGLLLLGVLAGCSAGMHPTETQPVPQYPYQLSLDFHSTLPDPYYVLSGPAQTYDRFPVNERFAQLLRERLARQSQPGAERNAVLAVYVEALHTSFDEIGLGPKSGNIRLAMNETAMADAGPEMVGDMDRDGDFNLPEETIKQATMELRLVLSSAGRVLGEKSLNVSYTEKHNWYFEHPATLVFARYGYASVLEGLYREAQQEISGFLAAQLG